jgi:hypothetical protein
MRPTYSDDENVGEEVPPYPEPDFTAPPQAGEPETQPTSPPMLSIPEEPHVPAELRVHRLYDPRPEIDAARAQDRKSQDQSDLRELLLAATQRRAPQLRSLGAPELQAVLEKQKFAPQPVDEEMRKAQLAALLRKDQPKPEKIDALGDAEKRARLALMEKQLAAPPKTEKPPTPNAFTPLDQANRDYWEAKVGKLPPGATLEDVKTLQGSIVNPKATQSIAAAGLGIKKEEIAKTDAEKAAKQAGNKVIFGSETWELPEGVNPGDTAVGAVRKAAGDTAMVDTSLSELRNLFAKAVADPTNQTIRAQIKSRSGILAPKMNQVLGQGAMAAQEYDRVKQSIGDLGSKEFWLGALQSMENDPKAGAALVAQLDEARKSFRESFESTARAAQFRKTGSGGPSGKVLMRRGDDFQWVDPKDVEAARKDGYFTKGEQ